ncbi:hypothetical protein J6590_087821 [Homalodisca vitripennis]|nr:hypothetical protein J6590_087821 [Homalodisca vitripennis]
MDLNDMARRVSCICCGLKWLNKEPLGPHTTKPDSMTSSLTTTKTSRILVQGYTIQYQERVDSLTRHRGNGLVIMDLATLIVFPLICGKSRPLLGLLSTRSEVLQNFINILTNK